MAPDYSSSVGTVVAADEQLTDAALQAAPTRSTKLLQLDISTTHLLYDPGGRRFSKVDIPESPCLSPPQLPNPLHHSRAIREAHVLMYKSWHMRALPLRT